ncbi:MAG: transposase family protein [Gemmatimonadetes bacterium]|nr:transposase family protein [Gemmatimonadota bacterium]
MIHARLAEFPALQATRLFAECRAAATRAATPSCAPYVGTLRPASAPVVRFETAPGEQAQVDFAHCRLPWGIRYALIVVLGYSRLLWVRFYPRQDLRTLQQRARRLPGRLGRCPAPPALRPDAERPHPRRSPRRRRPAHQSRVPAFAQHYGFRLRVCRPYRAQTKGKVERPIRYLRGSFLRPHLRQRR